MTVIRQGSREAKKWSMTIDKRKWDYSERMIGEMRMLRETCRKVKVLRETCRKSENIART